MYLQTMSGSMTRRSYSTPKEPISLEILGEYIQNNIGLIRIGFMHECTFETAVANNMWSTQYLVL